VNLGAHAGFIVAAYAVALAVVGALIAWIMIDYRAQRRALVELERRSAGRGQSERPT
jgi:heme exporter protein D